MKLSDKIDKAFDSVFLLVAGINIGTAFHFVFPDAVVWLGIISVFTIPAFFLIWLIAGAAEENQKENNNE